jgi:hypothetical protein
MSPKVETGLLMKKLLGLTLQCVTLIALGYTFLNNSLVLIADWLSPILSGQIYSFFTLLFLIFGDPIKYPEIVAMWGLSSVIAGLLIRKRIGSILTVLSTWLFIVSLSGVLVFGLVTEAQKTIVFEENMDPFDVMPPFPEGLTATSLFEAPILGEIFHFSFDIMQEGVEDLDYTIVLTQVANLFIFSLVSKPIISMVFSLIGVELGKKIEHLVDPTITEKRLLIKNRLVKEGKLIAILMVLILGTFTTTVSALVTEGFYTENFVTIVNEKGQAFVSGVFAGDIINGIDPDIFGYDGYMGSILVSHQNIIDVFYEYMDPPEEVDFSEILNLLPETFVLFLYLDVDSNAAQTHSDSVAVELSTIYDMEIIELFSFSQKIEEDFAHTFTVNIYQSSLTLDEFNQRYLQHYHNYGGYITSIQGDQMIPGKTSDSVDGSLLFTGYLISASFLELVPVDPSMIPLDLNREIIGVAGFVGYWDNCARILDDLLSIEEIFNLDNELEYSDNSDFSSSIIIAPSVDTLGKSTNTLKMSTSVSLPVELEEMIEGELFKMGLNAEVGEHITIEQMQIDIGDYPLPMDLQISREITHLTPNKINVKIVILNQDKSTAHQVLVDDTASLEKYQNVATIGNLKEQYISIEPGETKVYEYTVEIDNPGSYKMTPVTLSYTNENIYFEAESTFTSFSVDRPNSLENLGNTFSSLLDSNEELSQYLPNNISTALQLSSYAIILYTIVDGVRKLRSWILS